MREYDAPVGALVVHPASVDGRAQWSCTRESVIVAFRPEHMLELAASEFDVGQVTFRPPPFGTIDVSALRIAELLKAELAEGAGNELYVDSLITVFGIHLLRNYADMRKPLPSMKGGLSGRVAARVKDFLDANFTRKLLVAELAAMAGLSPRHFILAFSTTFGRPPHQYLIERRLALAEELLVNRDLSIAEVAHLCGFSDQSHLTAVMSKYRNRTPKQVRLQR
ncbi:AraC family transcriptional regulator [Terrarubrum flagellatum]|uniref:helix-turn-helix transcriptional regulator n=1 Tax=Terrirubrum flagellatum TaxID=2895980 RepID=UPI0031455388